VRGERTLSVHADVRRRADVERLVGAARAAFGRVDVLVNNAGILRMSPIVALAEAELDLVLDTNLKGVFYGVQAALRVMRAQRSGCIVNLTSQGIDGASPNMGAYSMTKAAIAMLTKTAATEGAPYNIRVNAVGPGWVETPMVSFRWQADEERPAVLASVA